MNINSDVKKFDEKLLLLNISPYEAEFDGKSQGVFYLKKYHKTISFVEYDEFNSDLHNCRECRSRIHHFASLADKNGPILTNFCNEKQKDILKRVCSGTFDICIIDNKFLMGYEKDVGGFPHVYFKTAFTPKDKKPLLIQQAVKRYISDGLFQNTMNNLIECNDGKPLVAIDSLNCFIECCDEAVYGMKFINTAKWLINIMQKYNDFTCHKSQLYLGALIDAGIEEDLSGAVVTAYHQANNNIIPLLGDAKSKDAMIKLIASRLDPLKYQRRDTDAILTDGNIANAEKHLGDFVNTIMNFEDLEKIPDCIKICNSKKLEETVQSSLSGFASMRLKTQPKTSFAAKCNNHEDEKRKRENEIRKINSMSQLCEYLENHKESKVEINTSSSHPVYIANTTLDREKIITPHFWAFGRSFKITSSWCEVKYILPMYKYITSHKNIAFIIDNQFCKVTKVRKNVIDVNKITNCCIPEFLVPKYSRVCGKAFERLQTTTQIGIRDEELALGVGTSVSDRNNILLSNIKLRIDGIEIIINKL